jgi:hypothetical protein
VPDDDLTLLAPQEINEAIAGRTVGSSGGVAAFLNCCEARMR